MKNQKKKSKRSLCIDTILSSMDLSTTERTTFMTLKDFPVLIGKSDKIRFCLEIIMISDETFREILDFSRITRKFWSKIRGVAPFHAILRRTSDKEVLNLYKYILYSPIMKRFGCRLLLEAYYSIPNKETILTLGRFQQYVYSYFSAKADKTNPKYNKTWNRSRLIDKVLNPLINMGFNHPESFQCDLIEINIGNAKSIGKSNRGNRIVFIDNQNKPLKLDQLSDIFSYMKNKCEFKSKEIGIISNFGLNIENLLSHYLNLNDYFYNAGSQPQAEELGPENPRSEGLVDNSRDSPKLKLSLRERVKYFKSGKKYKIEFNEMKAFYMGKVSELRNSESLNFQLFKRLSFNPFYYELYLNDSIKYKGISS